MTIYYIDPTTGSDASSGLSWGSAWASFQAIESRGVMLLSGDTVRVAKSPEVPVVPGVDGRAEVHQSWRTRPVSIVKIVDSLTGAVLTGGEGVYYYNSGSPGGYRGGLLMMTDDRVHLYYNDGADKTAFGATLYTLYSLRGGGTLSPLLTQSGVAYSEDFANAAHATSAVYAVSTTGHYNVQDAKLFSVGTLTILQTEMDAIGHTITVERISSEIRCFTAFSGVGADTDMPSGALRFKAELRAYVGGALLQEVYSSPLPAIRNSESVWTPVTVTFPTPIAVGGVTGVVLDVYLCRTSLVLDRDTADYGLVVRPPSVHANSLGAPCLRVYKAARGAAIPVPYSYPLVGALPAPAYGSTAAGEIPAYISVSPTTGGAMLGGVHSADNYRLSETLTRIVPFYVHELAWRPAGRTGLFTFGSTTGGTLGSPVVISGGWDTDTGQQVGVTAFSGGLPIECTTDCALFDLQAADHFRFENLIVSHGFSSFFTRARTVHLLACSLPFSFKPGFGEVSTETHVTLDSMYVAPYVLEGFGCIGNYKLLNVYAPCDPFSSATSLCEVGDFYMNDSHFGKIDGTDPHPQTAVAPLRIRGNAVVDNCAPLSTWCLVSVRFGHTLAYVNPKAVPLAGGVTKYNVQGVFPHPESRWDSITYASHPTYKPQWTDYYGTLVTPTSAYPRQSCDYLIDETAIRMTIGASWLESSVYKQANDYAFDSEYRYTGRGAELDLIGALDGWTGPQTLVHQGSLPIHTLVPTGAAARYATQTSTPPLERQSDAGGPEYLTYSPEAATTGVTLLAKKLAGVSYRKDTPVYLCVPSSGIYYPDWSIYVTNIKPRRRTAVLKVVYVPRGGQFTAHFGFMKENVRPTPLSTSTRSPWEAPRRYDGNGQLTIAETPDTLLGSVAVRVSGKPQAVPYRSSTAQEISGAGSNKRLDRWVDMYIDFDMVGPGDVQMELWSTIEGSFNFCIFDTLEITERD